MTRSSDPGTPLEASGRTVTITNGHKVFFPQRGETKLDLARYYAAVEGPLLAALGGRPVMMQRFPDGVGGNSFFQKRVPANAPPWLRTTEVVTPNGTTSNALVLADLAHVLWAVNLGCIGFHPWAYRADDPGHVDELRLDLDPQPGVSFGEVCAAARATRALLAEAGLVGYLKTSGSRGLHVYVRLEPRWTAIEVRAAAVAVARELARRHPSSITAAWWKEERGRRVFVDFNQNAPHKTVFGAWCVRPRVGGQVSTPVRWDDLDGLDPDALTLSTVPGRVVAAGDPWADAVPQSLEPLVAMARRDHDAGLPDAPWPPEYPKQPDEATRVAPSRARRDGSAGVAPDHRSGEVTGH